jgi:hypothetical protein
LAFRANAAPEAGGGGKFALSLFSGKRILAIDF